MLQVECCNLRFPPLFLQSTSKTCKAYPGDRFAQRNVVVKTVKFNNLDIKLWKQQQVRKSYLMRYDNKVQFSLLISSKSLCRTCLTDREEPSHLHFVFLLLLSTLSEFRNGEALSMPLTQNNPTAVLLIPHDSHPAYLCKHC